MLAACSGGDDSAAGPGGSQAPPAPPTTEALPSTTTDASGSSGRTDPTVPALLAQFPTTTIGLGDRPWMVAVADTAELRFQGLRGVDDLGPLDGMLFVFPTDTAAAFTMRGTVMPIDIAFFDADGMAIDRIAMVPCEAEPCPVYEAAQPFRYALETERGGFEGIELVLDPP